MGIAGCFGVDLAAGRTQAKRDLGSAQVDPGVELVRFCHQSGLATSQYITDQRSWPRCPSARFRPRLTEAPPMAIVAAADAGGGPIAVVASPARRAGACADRGATR